jgi:hypothetical protein
MMEWPNRFLLVVLCTAAVAVFAPWFIPRTRHWILIRFIAALAATACWISYENHLHSIARPGDPLIRIDLFLVAPLILLDWLSAIASIVVQRWRERKAK